MRLIDYFFYFNEGSSAFDMRDVVGWKPTGQDYYRQYSVNLKDGRTVALKPDEFYTFEKRFKTLEELDNG